MSVSKKSVCFFFCLTAILAAIFHSSLSPSQTLFSNDSPLGILSSEALRLPEGFSGYWLDLNWLGAWAPSAVPGFSFLWFWLCGPLIFGKTYAPVSLLLLGCAAWIFFRQLRFSPMVSALGGLAAALNMNAFSNACWGLGSRALVFGTTFLALAALQSRCSQRRWVTIALAGLAVGMGIMEGYDVGAIFSLYVAAFVMFVSLNEGGATPQNIARGIGRVAVVAMFSAFIAASAIFTLIETQVKGVAGTAAPSDPLAVRQKWDFATQWSLPKVETVRVLLPGVFGYGMPEMYSIRSEDYNGAHYWGAVGQSPGNERSRFSGAGEYAGVLVVLLALWAVLQSFRGPGSPLSQLEKRSVWFWFGAALVSLVLAWGRHAPVYQFLYALPWFSTIRNPIKFMHPFQVSMLILCAHGLQGFWKCYLAGPVKGTEGIAAHLKSWLKRAPVFEKRWVYGSATAVVLSFFGWLIYVESKPALVKHLESILVDPGQAAEIARFSASDVGWFVLFLLLSVASLILLMSGFLAGSRQRWAAVLLGVVLVADLARANAPWLVYYDYKEKYATNPILEFLRKETARHRVQVFPFSLNNPEFAFFQQQYYYVTWLQNLFQYYNIRSLDVIQEPRMGADKAAYRAAFISTNVQSMIRYWELTNTRYHFGMAGSFTDQINQQLDPVKKRFKQHTAFTLVQEKAGGPITVVTNSAGPLAMIEFSGALPRVALYTNWEIGADDAAVLNRLVDPAFDPLKTVLVSDANLAKQQGGDSGNGAGVVEMKSYAPKRIVYQAKCNDPSVLMMNDRFSPDWKVWVDGMPQPILRCNFIMRGVSLPAGEHEVEFRFEPGYHALYVSLAAIGVALGLCGWLTFRSGKAPGAKREIEK